jgi:predicted ATPase
LVGREKALSELLVYLRPATHGERQIVLVTGEAGIGKTALVDLLQHQAALEIPGLRIVRGQCIESYGGTEAYYPMLEALGQWCRDSAATGAVDLLASYAPTWLAQFPELLTRQHREALQQEILGATRGRMLREIAVALDVMTSVSPLLLIFEDLQWVDHSTVDLVSVLARRRASAKLMLIATMRPIDSMPVGHPLRALRKDLLLHRVCHEIDVKPLTEAQIAEYLTAESTPEALPEGLAAFVYRHTEGNPLFMVAALDYLCQRGFISRAGTGWRLATPVEALELGVPDNLRQMIEAQIERLSAQEQHALEAASVAGAMFLASACAVALGVDREDIEELYDVLARRHRVVRYIDRQRLPDGSVTSRYDFVHALYREVLYRRQALRRRANLHRRIDEHLETIRSQTAQNRS